MSRAKPKPSEWRAWSWGESWRMTVRQRRRYAKKMCRMGDDTENRPASSFNGPGAKGRPTPRRADAIAGRLAGRRFVEASRERRAAEASRG